MLIKFLFCALIYFASTSASGQESCDSLSHHSGYKQTVSNIVHLDEMKVIAPFNVLAGEEMACVLVSFYIDSEGKPYGYESVGSYPDNRLLRFATRSLRSGIFKLSQESNQGFMYFELKRDDLMKGR